MSELLCNTFNSLDYFARNEDLYFTTVFNCVLNAILCLMAVLVNALAIVALRKTSSLSKVLKILLTSLVVSDLGVGLLGQPLFVALMAEVTTLKNHEQPDCFTLTSFFVVSGWLSEASFFTITALTVDRFVALQFSLRYHQIVTPKRVTIVVTMIWLYSLFTQLVLSWLLHPDTASLWYSVIGFNCLIALSLIYLKIYLIVRHHKRQIQDQVEHSIRLETHQVPGNAARLTKSALSTFYIYIVFLGCYLPLLVTISFQVLHSTSAVSSAVFYYSSTLVYLNSCLNPVVYCWRMKHIRQTMKDTLRSLLTCTLN